MQNYDVIILGSGLAGLTLARQLLLESDKRILVLDKSEALPTPRQKWGESTVQVGGYYFSKVLDLEQYLWHEHFMKYNLRFYFKTPGRDNSQFEDYSQAYIRTFSNIGCYQVDRNRFEHDLLEMNKSESRFTVVAPASDIEVQLEKETTHSVTFTDGDNQVTVSADWVVDTTGRGRALSRQMDTREEAPINNGAAFMWVDGTVDIEKLTDGTLRDNRLNRARRSTGHLPHWLATNHFMGEGFWFWVIPLRNKTSLGLVYDNELVDGRQFNNAEALRDWVCEEFPLFKSDLESRRILDFNTLKRHSHSCKQTISSEKWAMSGVSGRFTDPLYSPGSDFIAIHNTLIVDAIKCVNERELGRKCWLAELVMQSCYRALLPSFNRTYDALGDQETFVLKYTWELTVYFAFYVFPFINDLLTNGDFVPAYLSRFSKMGDINHSVQTMISGYYQWKKTKGAVGADPIFHDFTSLSPLRNAESTFYEVGLSWDEAKAVLDQQLANLEEFGQFIIAYIYSVVLDESTALHNASFIREISFKDVDFDEQKIRELWERHRDEAEVHGWSLDPSQLKSFESTRPTASLGNV